MKRETAKEKMYRLTAQILHNEEGSLEIDDNAAVSIGGDSGAYVQAWVWVSDDDVKKVSNGSNKNA